VDRPVYICYIEFSLNGENFRKKIIYEILGHIIFSFLVKYEIVKFLFLQNLSEAIVN